MTSARASLWTTDGRYLPGPSETRERDEDERATRDGSRAGILDADPGDRTPMGSHKLFEATGNDQGNGPPIRATLAGDGTPLVREAYMVAIAGPDKERARRRAFLTAREVSEILSDVGIPTSADVVHRMIKEGGLDGWMHRRKWCIRVLSFHAYIKERLPEDAQKPAIAALKAAIIRQSSE